MRARTVCLLIGALALSPLTPAAAADPDDSGVLAAYLVGRFAAQTGDLSRASDEFQLVMRDGVSVPQVAGQAFIAALLADRPELVADAARLPDNPLAQLVLADTKAKAGQWAAAESLNASLDAQQALGKLLRPLLVAWSRFGQGEVGSALDLLTPLAAGPTMHGVYALHAALIADLGGRLEQAGHFYAIAKQDFGPTNLRLIQILASWEARHGDEAQAQQAIDELTAKQGELAMARSGLKASASELAVRNGTDGIAEAYLALAATLRPQNAGSAQAVLHLALDLRPDLTAARILLSEIEEGEKLPKVAMATLAAVAPDDPLAPLVELRRAGLLAQTEHVEAARALLQRLAAEHPDQPDPLAQEGDMLRREKKYAEAAKVYSEAVARIGQPSRANWPIFYALGIAYERSGNWPAAESDLKTALELSPGQPGVENYLAYSWTERGEHLDEARTLLDKAIAAQPDDGAIIDSLGWLLLRQGDVAAAVERLTKAAELMPEDPTINGHLGDALAAAGRWREAEFQWRRALTFKPDEEDAKRINERLATMPTAAR